MQEYNTINMLACKEVVVNKVRESDNLVVIEAHTKKLKSCPCCGSKHIWVHDHRTQKIKDTQMHGKKCIINLRKTRYNCKCCGKRIDSKTELVAKKMTMTKRLIASIAREFKELYSIKSISRRYSVSTATVTRVLSYLSVERKSLPKVLLIDDLFKGSISKSDINIMFELINHRYFNKLPVIVSTELSIENLVNIDEALGSRLIEMSKDFLVGIRNKKLNYRIYR